MKVAVALLAILTAFRVTAQDTDEWERLQDREERTIETEPLTQEQQFYRRRPLNLNTATAETLHSLGLLTHWQVQQLIAYRKQMGPLAAVEELQAVPGWDPATIRRLQPFITVQPAAAGYLRDAVARGTHQLVLRYARVLQETDGERKGQFAGNADRVYARYRFRHAGRLRWGITMEKDAGEAMRRGRPDFFSAHLQLEGRGLIRQLSLGDFTVNMGQGLVHWQGFAFGGGADLLAYKRQGAVVQPYLAGDEFRFHRGAALTLQRGRWQATLFGSARCLSIRADTDSSLLEQVSSFNRSGLHRTPSELAGRNRLRQLGWGGRLQWERGPLRLGMHAVDLRFSMPLQQGDKPYQLFQPSGTRLFKGGADWGFTWRNLHLFGEVAVGGRRALGMVGGLLLAGGRPLDLALVYRRLPPGFPGLHGNALTRRSEPQNEEGLLMGVQLRPKRAWQVDAWMDAYRFPWLRYGIDAPTQGFRAGVQASWRPEKERELQLRYQFQEDPEATTQRPLNGYHAARRHGLRLQLQDPLSARLLMQLRAEALWEPDAGAGRSGFLFSGDLRRRFREGFSIRLRGQYFATDGYAFRLYQFDPDGSGGGPILPFYDKGLCYCLILQHAVKDRFNLSMRWADTFFRDQDAVSSGMTRIEGPRRSELRLQFSLSF